ncbi:cupin [Halobacteriales archaeon QH_8_64_26]|nr:MAG: cupin [Halobacteriales archaeon QH_8_64_26]
MVTTDFERERTVDEERFVARTVAETDLATVALGYFEPGQFIPVHTPDSDVVIAIEAGRGRVRDGDRDRPVEPGDIAVVPAGRSRGVRAASDGRLEALLLTAPPPTDEEHDPVRRGLERGEFEPTLPE